MAEVGADFVPVSPVFPENRRTIYMGHLFVGDVLLSESSMRDHPITPMTEANLVRVLQAQLREHSVGLVDYRTVVQGPAAIERRFAELRKAGFRLAIVDGLEDAHLGDLAAAARSLPLVVAGSGLAAGMARADTTPLRLPVAVGGRAIISGSCSESTNRQVVDFTSRGGAAFQIDPLAGSARDIASEAAAWAAPWVGAAPLLISATAEPQIVRSVQARLGAEEASRRIEVALGEIAVALVDAGVRQLIVAGGETSGACVARLGVRLLEIGPQIDPGVPWCFSPERGIHLALKSGNFGGVDFFTRAFEVLS
jgi:uncharacterized protein YgbK (DUF1537 family)